MSGFNGNEISALIGQALKQTVLIDGKTLRVAVYGIFVKEGRVLMTYTCSGSKFIYNFPGGSIELGDLSLQDALCRECKEELHCAVTVKEQLFISQRLHYHDDFPNSCGLNVYFCIEVQDKGPDDGLEILQAGAEVDHIAWFEVSKLPFEQMRLSDKEFAESYFLR